MQYRYRYRQYRQAKLSGWSKGQMGLYLCVRRPNSCRDKEVGSQRIAGLVQDVSEPQVTVHSNQDIEEHATAAGGTGNSDYKLQRFCQIWQYHNKCLVWQVLIVTVNRLVENLKAASNLPYAAAAGDAGLFRRHSLSPATDHIHHFMSKVNHLQMTTSKKENSTCQKAQIICLFISTQTACTVTRSPSKRTPLTCGGTGYFCLWCAAVKPNAPNA